MNIFKYFLVLLLVLGIGSQELLSTTTPPAAPQDPFGQTGCTILTDFTILSNTVNQDLTNNQNLWTAIYFLGDFINDYIYVTPAIAQGYWPTIALTDPNLTTMSSNFVTAVQTVWAAICKNLAPGFTGTVQTTSGQQSSNCPTSDTMNQISVFGGALDLAIGTPAAFLSSTQQIQNISGAPFVQPASGATTTSSAPAAGTVNGVLQNYYFLCSVATGGATTSTPPTTSSSINKTVTVTKGAGAAVKTAAKSQKTVVIKTGPGIKPKPIVKSTVVKKTAAKK